MSIGVIIDVHLKPGGAEKMFEIFKERLPKHTREWDGCEDIYLYADSEDPNHLYLVERWESREKYDKYREWAMSQPNQEELASQIEGEMKTIYLDDTGA
jgi:quinol monooxygenase YgiN